MCAIVNGCEGIGDGFENSGMSTTTPKAYSYIRFSTPEQASGDSYRRQAELSNRYAEEHGLNLDTSLSLCDLGVSGFTGENRSKGALALFLKAVETGKVPAGSFLLVESLDRLSRDTMSEQMSLFIGLINAGLTVVTLAEGQSYSKTTINNDLSKLMLSLVIMMRAHEESLTKSRRIKAAWEAKLKSASEEILSACCLVGCSCRPIAVILSRFLRESR
jgi:DNA invertase Pin-like site-specific DNA recombinase